MRLVVRYYDLDASEPVVLMHEDNCAAIGVKENDRVSISGMKSTVALVTQSDTLVDKGIILMPAPVLERAGAECTLEARDDTYGGIKMIERFAHLFPRKPGQLNSEAERWRKTMEYGMTIRPIEEYHGEPVYKVVFIAPNEACLAEAKQLYEDQFIFCESRLGDTPSAIVNGELINRKFNKGTGIKAICDELGCSLADTIGFGDSDNDLQMTDVVGISVCMANGSDNLKKLCDRICPAVTEDGVARELKTLGLI